MSDQEAKDAEQVLSHITGKDERKVIAFANGSFSKARDARQQFEKNWYMNLAFYFGKQWAQWTPQVNGFAQLKVPKAPPWRVRLVSNKIRPIIRTELSKVTKEKPQAYVVPATGEDEDLLAAKAAEHLFEYHWRELTINRVIRRAEFWNLLTGAGFIKDWYDKDLLRPDGTTGFTQVEAISPFHIFAPDMQEEELENQPFIIHALAKSPDWVKTRFPEEAKEVNPDANAGPDVLEQKFFSALGLDNPPKDYVMVKEMWVKPCSKFKEGAVITWANNKLLQLKEGWPYDHGQYPFTKLDHIPTGRFYSDSTIPDLIPLQKEYNRTRSQIIEAKNRMSKPQLTAARGSMDPKKITSEPGLVILYTPGFNPPTPIPLQGLPSYVLEEQDRIQRDMDDISSQHEVTKGRTPPGVTAATAISYLQEEDDSKLSFTISSLEEGVERIGRHILSHVQQFWDEERTIQVLGDDGRYEAHFLSNADLKGNTDLHVQSGSATPRSRAAKQAFIMELMSNGYVDPAKGLRYLDMAETSKMYEEMQVDSRHAQRENLRMAEAVPVDVNTWDNHEIHIQEHNNYRKTQEFENLDEETQAIFEAHVIMHQQVGMMQAMGAMPGMPPGALPGEDPNATTTADPMAAMSEPPQPGPPL